MNSDPNNRLSSLFQPFSSPLTNGDPQTPTVNPTNYYNYGNLPMRVDPRVVIPQDAPPHKDLQLICDPHIEAFKLWDPDDNKKLIEVFERIGRGMSTLRYDEHEFVQEHNSWVILLAWVDWFWEMPKNAKIVPPKQDSQHFE